MSFGKIAFLIFLSMNLVLKKDKLLLYVTENCNNVLLRYFSNMYILRVFAVGLPCYMYHSPPTPIPLVL